MQDMSSSRHWGAAALLLLLALALSAALGLRALKETGSTNSYALVAQSLLTKTPDVPRCFDKDCAVRDGKTYVVFPPFPAIVAMPLVAWRGVEAKGFIELGIGCLLLSLLVWRAILRKLDVPPALHLPLLAAIAFASPLYYVTLRSEGIWFFAQAVAFPLVSLAIHETLAGRLLLAGAALAAAFLCRQMSIFYAPLLLLLSLPLQSPLFGLGREHGKAALKLALPIALGIAFYLAYNYWRFGALFDTGYAAIIFPEGIMRDRVAAHGLWSLAYAPFNAFYLLLQGFHADFAEPQRLVLTGLDTGGASILSASPWLLYLVFAPWRRDTVGCGLLILGFCGALLFYHSNGFSQYNAQRYMLDWLPAALLMLAAALKRANGELFRPLAVWGMALNLATVGVLAVTHAG